MGASTFLYLAVVPGQPAQGAKIATVVQMVWSGAGGIVTTSVVILILAIVPDEVTGT